MSDTPLPLSEVEWRHIREVVRATGANLTEAARVLGINRRTLYRKLRARGVTREASRFVGPDAELLNVG